MQQASLCKKGKKGKKGKRATLQHHHQIMIACYAQLLCHEAQCHFFNQSLQYHPDDADD